MRISLTIILLWAILASTLLAQKTAADYGFTHLTFDYKTDKVDLLIKSKKGEEKVPKPLFFFCQGSLPQPLIKYEAAGAYGVFPFNPDSLSAKYHLVIVGKPYIPLMAEVSSLGPNFSYIDSSGNFPKQYSERNLLSYYVARNLAILKFLKKQAWVSNKELVFAGHSEGSTIAAKMAVSNRDVTHLIYSGGNPMGRILSIIQQSRAFESDTDSTRYGEMQIEYWENIVKNKANSDASQGDSDKTTYEFSHPPMEYLEKLKIPVLVCYGTKDWSAPFNDYMRVDFLRKGKTKVQFKAYIGTEHNYFPLDKDNRPDYNIFNWDKVAMDWLYWLEKK